MQNEKGSQEDKSKLILSSSDGFKSAPGLNSTWKPAWLEDFEPNRPVSKTENSKPNKNRRVKQAPKKVIVAPPHLVDKQNDPNQNSSSSSSSNYVINRGDLIHKKNLNYLNRSLHVKKSTKSKCKKGRSHKKKKKKKKYY